jgi:hypothetical protein
MVTAMINVIWYSLRRQGNKLHVGFVPYPFSLRVTWYQLGRLPKQFGWVTPFYFWWVALHVFLYLLCRNRGFRFLKYCAMNAQKSQLLKRYFSKQKAPFVGHVCVYALRPCSCLTFKVQILIVLLIFVAMEFLSPYLRKRFCLFRRYWVFPWLHSYKW